MTKKPENLGKIPIMRVAFPTNVGDQQFSHPSSLPSQEELQPQEENQAYGSVLPDISTMLAGLLWKIPLHLLQLYDLKLSFPIEYACADFYEHRQKLLQPFFFPPPNLSNQL